MWYSIHQYFSLLQSYLSTVKSHGTWKTFHYRQVFTIDKSKIVKNMFGGPENRFTIDKFECIIDLYSWSVISCVMNFLNLPMPAILLFVSKHKFSIQLNLSIVKSHGTWKFFHYRQVFTVDKSKIVKNMLGGPETLFTIDKFSLFTSFTNDKFNCRLNKIESI